MNLKNILETLVEFNMVVAMGAFTCFLLYLLYTLFTKGVVVCV